MADKKISQLTAATTPLAGTEVLPIVQGGATVKVSIADVTAGRAVSATSIVTGLGAPAPDAGLTLDSGGAGDVGIMLRRSGAGQLDTAIQNASGALALRAGSDSSTIAGLPERMRITSAGNVGVGITAPLGLLHVNSTGTTNAIVSGSDAARLVINGDTINSGDTGTEDASLIFNTDGAYDPTVNSGLGSSGFRIGYLNGSSANTLVFVDILTGVDRERMRIDASGNVGIGTSPAFQLQLSTDSAAKPATNLWTIASDSRIKTETGEYTKGLDAVCALRPVTYHYNGTAGFVDDGKENISIIAQEAMQHFPECVGTFEVLLNEDDEEKTELFNWNGHALVFALVNAVKELKAMNETLAARVAQIEGV